MVGDGGTGFILFLAHLSDAKDELLWLPVVCCVLSTIYLVNTLEILFLIRSL